MPVSTNVSRALGAQLREVFAKAKMPSSPRLAARILELIGDPTSSATDFGNIIRADPALSARLLKMANSAYFAQRTSVTTIERAVTVLGLERVKTISLGFQLIAPLDRLGDGRFDMKAFWQHSLLRACLARSIAQTVVPSLVEEAFLVGLLEDAGIIVLVQALGPAYSDLHGSAHLSPAAFYAVEKASFPYTHVDAIAVMASEWSLPEIIALPLARHHHPVKLSQGSSDIRRLTAVGSFVGSLGFARDLTIDPSELDPLQFGMSALGIDDDAWEEIQRFALEDYEKMSILYAKSLPQDVDVSELLSEANRQLAAVANEADLRVLDVVAERERLLREQKQLERSLAEYREQAARDPLTGLLNRGGLVEAVRRAIEQSRNDGRPIGVLFADIDNFKDINDAFGHDAGDKVLKAVGASLDKEVYPSGAVGRYGGEEFVAVLRGVGVDEIRQTAERIVMRVRGLDLKALGFDATVRCSVGAVATDGARTTSAEELIAAADECMYRAKRGGKDRCCFDALTAPSDPVEAGECEVGDVMALPTESVELDVDVASGESYDQLRTVAERLEREQLGMVTESRKEQRKTLIAPCTLHCFTDAGETMHAELAFVRNISTGGLCLVVARPLIRGEPVEVELNRNDSTAFFASLVAYCRQVEGPIHEVGLQFVVRSVDPVISGNAQSAIQNLDWVAKALSERGP
jgi:diguanylate cyclase (GGDEF)-like protein